VVVAGFPSPCAILGVRNRDRAKGSENFKWNEKSRIGSEASQDQRKGLNGKIGTGHSTPIKGLMLFVFM
jgi:hypothetical protein